MFGFTQPLLKKEDTALIISDEWRNKINMCKNDFTALIKEKQVTIQDFVNKEDYENADKEMHDIDTLNNFIDDIDYIIEKYKYYPFLYV